MIRNELYLEDVNLVANLDLPWEKFRNSSFLITGASGLLGSFLVDVLMKRNATGNELQGLCDGAERGEGKIQV